MKVLVFYLSDIAFFVSYFTIVNSDTVNPIPITIEMFVMSAVESCIKIDNIYVIPSAHTDPNALNVASRRLNTNVVE